MARRTDKSTDKPAEPVQPVEPVVSADGTRLRAESVTLAYDQRVITRDLTVAVPDRSFTVIVGPNACGKSTLLRALSRLLRPSEGRVLLDGRAIGGLPAKSVARTLGLLPQSSVAPDGITVSGLVARGRYPHQGLLRQWSAEDERIVDESMAATGIAALADRYVDELSGGQRQRVWIAMALAQQTPLLLLDEPTTFLDIQHQIDVLDLCAELHEQRGRTLVAVLHDLNQAARYATHLIAMRDGRIEAQGPPAEIIDAELVERVFGVRCRIIEDPESGTPLVIPAARRRTGPAPAEESVPDADAGSAVAATAGSAAGSRPAGPPGV
jgi:iron complex transport system ATP-binding protein